MYMLLPYLQSNLRAAIATLQKGHRNIRAGTDNCTCVVHFRAGDFTHEISGGMWRPRDVRRAVAALVLAAASFPSPVHRFEVLGSGFDHKCRPTREDCGLQALDQIVHSLKTTYAKATVVSLRCGTADEDFVRMASAPMLLLGSVGTDTKVASSFSVYAAVASAGDVRLPACLTRFGECIPTSVAQPGLAPRWLGYLHPNCARCRPGRRTL